MRNDYFDSWLAKNNIKKACVRCDTCDQESQVTVSKALKHVDVVTPLAKQRCDTCDNDLEIANFATPATPTKFLKCDNDITSEAFADQGLCDLSHVSHLTHQKNKLTEKELREIHEEFRLWGRVKCKYCSYLNFRGFCSGLNIKHYRPLNEKWRRCSSYKAIEQIRG